MYKEGTDSSSIDGYNEGLLEVHDNWWDEAREYYKKIFKRELREAKQLWKEEGVNNEYSEEMAEEYEEADDKWSSYRQKRDLNQSDSQEWFEDCPDDELSDAIERNQ
jgi:outer membrane protein assembly factor BamD (BamD/ComL family)